MQLSDLIAQLQEALHEHGDVVVYVPSRDSRLGHVEVGGLKMNTDNDGSVTDITIEDSETLEN